MKKLGKILLKDWVLILYVVAGILVQAYCELTLPEYTSGIVNIGIQQSGIQTHVPDVIRRSSMERLLALTDSASDSEEILSGQSDSEYLLSRYYPDEENGAAVFRRIVYVDKAQDVASTERLERILGIPMMKAYLSDTEGKGVDFGFDFSNILEDESSDLSLLDNSIVNQIAVRYLADEYKSLNIDLEQIRSRYMARTALKMTAYAFLAFFGMVIAVYFSSKIGTRFARDARSALYKKVLMFSNREYDYFSTASLITRSTNDVQQVQMMLTVMLRIMLFSPVIGLGALSKVISSGSSLAWILGVGIGVILVIIILMFVAVMPKFKAVQSFVDRLNLISREILTGIPVIRAFSKEEHEKKRFDTANTDLTKLNLFTNRAMFAMQPTMMFIMNGISVMIVWFGAKGVDLGLIRVGDLLALISYSMHVIMSFLMISMISIVLPRSLISAKRMGNVLDKEIKVNDPACPVMLPNSNKGVLEFKNVSFRYENADEDVLSGISFISCPGKVTAIIGSTGSGKSTIANLIPRFFDVTGGEILLSGVNIKNIPMNDLRKKIGFVPQKAMLLSGTVKSNIAYSNKDMDIERIKNAAEIAQAADFVEAMEEKYDSNIAQGGSNVSGGQRQRLAIARAIAKNPDVYVFDDCFSALDFKTDAKLRQALFKTTKNSSVIIVAQRISTILNADEIIVLDDGCIAGKGTHKELLESCEVYRDIAYSQLSPQELGVKEEA